MARILAHLGRSLAPAGVAVVVFCISGVSRADQPKSTHSNGIYGESAYTDMATPFADDAMSTATETPPIEPVPEPGTLALTVIGVSGLYARLKHRRNLT